MIQVTGDVSLWFKSVERGLRGMMAVYVNDQLAAGEKTFENDTRITECKLKSLPRQYNQLSFASVEIS